MHGLGLAKGDRIALLLPDCREYLEADYGTMAAGFVRVPMDPRLTRRELAELLQRAGVRALVTHPSFGDKVERLTQDVESLQSIVFVGKGPGLDYEALLEKSSDEALPDGDGDDLATLNFSGGTTGAPKAVMLRHRNLMTVAENTIQGFDIASDAVFLNVRPLWPIAQVILMSHLFAGATVVLGGRFDADRLAATIDGPARRGHRWCRRSSCAGSSICVRRTVCQGSKRSTWAARAFHPRCSSARSISSARASVCSTA